MTRFALISLSVLVVLAMGPFATMAQNTLPAFTMPDEQSGQIRRALPLFSMQAIDAYQPLADNTYLRDLIKLQHQIYIMEKLIERQTEIERVAEAYASMKIAYSRPAPPYGICTQLPANALCMAYYPNLYRGAMQSAQAKIAEEVTELVAMVQDANKKAEQVIADGKKMKKEAKEGKIGANKTGQGKGDYRWNDISCLAGACQAVIQDAEKSSFRQTVSLGDQLPDDSIIVAIAATGVRVKNGPNGKEKQLKPMPLGGAETIPNAQNPFGIPGLVNLDENAAPPPLFEFAPPPTPTSSADVPLEVQSSPEEGALVEAVPETQGESTTVAPVLPATGLTF